MEEVPEHRRGKGRMDLKSKSLANFCGGDFRYKI